LNYTSFTIRIYKCCC